MTETRDIADDRAPQPFLKWAGGKRQLLDRIVPLMPKPIVGRYVEPFVGGGAVFFELVALDIVRHARLADRNEELVKTYIAIRDAVDDVLTELTRHKNDETHFYEVRALDPHALAPARAAARTLYLNRVGYNGLYRVNSKGQFNVPFGRYANPKIVDEARLRAASRALQRAEIVCEDFEVACADVTAGDVVYFDPPYVPLTKTANFTAYAKQSFGDAEHARLAGAFGRAVEAGAFALLSNSDTPRTRELYRGWDVRTVSATRMINSKATARGEITEILVRGMRRGQNAQAS
jgi:DNA adenine methylase